MGEITVNDVAEFLTGPDNDYHEGLEGWPGLYAEDSVLHIEVKPGEDKDNPVYFHAFVRPGKYEEPLTEEPKGYGAVVLDREGDAWQLRKNGLWYAAIDGDDFSYWAWSDLAGLGPLTLLHPGYDDNGQEV